jgi:hypothetical protein
MDNTKIVLLKLDYGNRKDEKLFIAQILNRYDSDTLIGAVLYINNNPYNLQFLFLLNFKYKVSDFEDWLLTNYPNKKMVYNNFLSDISDSMNKRGFNVVGLTDNWMLDIIVTPEPNDMFWFPDRQLMENTFGTMKSNPDFTVFLSHSSKEKKIIEKIFSELQKSQIYAWFDKYEIKLGDSITEQINEGLERSDLGILLLSKNFIYSNSGWTMAEANFFFQGRMRKKRKNFFVINIDLEHDEIPPLMQDYKYINYIDSPYFYDDLTSEINKFKAANTRS